MPFVPNLFRYDEEEHKGYYIGELVPSITQLLEMIYPLDENIPTKNLEKAASRGTEIHELIEKFNKAEELTDLTPMLLDQNVLNYYTFLKTLNFTPYKFEELIFLCDENDNLIAYGHFDLLLKCLDENLFGERFELVLGDIKTTATIQKAKVKLQTELYRIGAKQTFHIDISDRTFVLHLRNGEIKFIPFDVDSEQKTIDLAKNLRKMWNERKQ